MFHILTWFVIFALPPCVQAAFSNPSSVLIGERAAGMAGAYTALHGDSAAAGFYNPASLSKITGNNVSASATLFNKFDTTYGEGGDIIEAGERVNRGFFRVIPSSMGNVYHSGSWALGFNIIVPDYDFFSGNIASTDETQSFLNYTDESLWSGVVASYKISETQSIGATLYYTARSYIRSAQDRVAISPTREILSNEEKSIRHNGLVFVLGYLWKVSKKVSLGFSARPPAISISGEGAYYRSTTDTDNLPSQNSQVKKTEAFSYIPPKYTIGIGVRSSERFTMSLDASYYTGHSYKDLAHMSGADQVDFVETWNMAFGAEYKFKDPNFDWRFGVFTNNSTHPDIPLNPTQRVGDHLDLLGFSSNIAFKTSENLQYTVGAFYHGGRGQSVQFTGNDFTRLDKNHHVFSLLISTSYNF